MAPDCVGPEVEKMAKSLQPGQVLMLENLRFHPEEEDPTIDPTFADNLAKLGDCYVNDAFGTAHRAHASTVAVPAHFQGKAAAGYLMEREIKFLSSALKNPARPFYAIIGGAKVSTKIEVLKSLSKIVDGLMLGGGMAFTFAKAKGIEIGKSLCENDFLDSARGIISDFESRSIPLWLPEDVVVADAFDNDAKRQTVDLAEGIPKGYQGMDIGPKTIRLYSDRIQKAGTVLWNGPVGVFEMPHFATGTLAIAQAMASTDAITIVGGGDSLAAIHQAGVADQITHLSTGGGATLELIQYGTLPGIEALTNKIKIKL
jgi:phosphoglycerate kinase